MNMRMTEKQLLKLVTDEIDYDMGYDNIIIYDEDDLHDYILTIKICGTTIEEYDYIYYQAIQLLSRIIDDVIEYIEECNDDVIGEQWRTYYSMIAM